MTWPYSNVSGKVGESSRALSARHTGATEVTIQRGLLFCSMHLISMVYTVYSPEKWEYLLLVNLHKAPATRTLAIALPTRTHLQHSRHIRETTDGPTSYTMVRVTFHVACVLNKQFLIDRSKCLDYKSLKCIWSVVSVHLGFKCVSVLVIYLWGNFAQASFRPTNNRCLGSLEKRSYL